MRRGDVSKWSHCMDCKYRLKWYDNVPIVSWLWLKGRCRKCGKGIGGWEIWSEVMGGVIFAVMGVRWWMNGAGLVGGELVRWGLMSGLMMVLLVGLMVLLVSDARWGRLPVKYLTFCAICAILYVATREWGVFSVVRIWDYLGALMMLSGVYYLLYKLSRERWVGSGDWLLCMPLALVLGNFWLAFFCLFLANLMGSIVMVPMSKVKKGKVRGQVPLGPFLIVAFVVVFLMQDVILGLVR